MRGYSAAADCGDDFQAIAILQQAVTELAPRHDFAVAFHGDAFAGQSQFIDQVGAGRGVGKSPGFAVDGDCDHSFMVLGCYGECLSVFYRPVPGLSTDTGQDGRPLNDLKSV